MRFQHRSRDQGRPAGRACLAALVCGALSLTGCVTARWRMPDRSESRALKGGQELNAALQSYQSGDIHQALDQTRRARREDPTLAASYELEALMQADLGNQAEYIAALRNAITSHPGVPRLQSAAGRMLVAAGERDEGLAAMQRAVRLAPRHTEYARDLAGVYLEAGDLTTAAAVLAAAKIQNPDDPELPVVLARLCESVGDWQQAAGEYQLVLQREPQNAVWRRQHAKCLYRLHRFPQAAHEFQKCQEIDVAALNVADRIEFGDACLQSDDCERAQRLFDELVEQGYETRDVAVLRGVCALRLGRPEQAEQVFENAVVHWPSDARFGLLLNNSREAQSAVVPVAAELQWMPPVPRG